MREELAEVKTQLEETRDQLTETNEQLTTTKTQLAQIWTATSNIAGLINGGLTPRVENSAGRSPSPSYASVLARAKDPAVPAGPAPSAAILYCTIDTSRVEGHDNERHPGTIRQTVENEMRTTEGHEGWRCMAVTKDPRNSARVRIACRDETELQQVKEAAQRKSWKAPGDDGLPAEVWKRTWPVVKDRVLSLFQTSLDSGNLPRQWKHAKIIPLKKPDKGDYTLAKAWRPISLLSTLGKILEAVVAERISHAVETSGLLPANHFGARKRRSTEQALVLLQEHIYKAWRAKRVLSLISFDVKGAYNGVCKERLLQRLTARRIPSQLVRWIDAFCSARTANLVVNGHTSESRALPQAGLPQGSPLSPVLFLFFNADLVQHRIDKNGGSIGMAYREALSA